MSISLKKSKASIEKKRATKAEKRQAKREGRSIKQQLEIAHAGWLAQLRHTSKR